MNLSGEYILVKLMNGKEFTLHIELETDKLLNADELRQELKPE